MEVEKEWFKSWFNTPYYHLLYQDRDQTEAAKVIENIKAFLKMPLKARILDLACGRGRHSLYLYNLGYDVTGVDIAEENINYAKKFENESLHFYNHDMRKAFRSNYFDYVLNLFSSFGYFKTEKEHYDSIKYAAVNLKKGGFLVIDFFNAEKVKNEYVKDEIKKIDGMEFHIRRFLKNDSIIKTITFKENDQVYDYSETVRLFTINDFEDLFSKAGLQLTAVKGDYNLKKFKPATSPRLILFAEKL